MDMHMVAKNEQNHQLRATIFECGTVHDKEDQEWSMANKGQGGG